MAPAGRTDTAPEGAPPTVAAAGGGGGAGIVDRPPRRTAAERPAGRALGSAGSAPVVVPVPGGRLTSPFSPRRLHPVLRRVRPHGGIDLAAPHGAPVVSGAEGRVLVVVRSATYGLAVDVAHRRGELITRYTHLSSARVRPGQAVARGEVIGRVGSTGLSAGPHLHFEVFVRGRRRDPAPLLGLRAAAAPRP